LALSDLLRPVAAVEEVAPGTFLMAQAGRCSRQQTWGWESLHARTAFPALGSPS
jgi:hypothetical protein